MRITYNTEKKIVSFSKKVLNQRTRNRIKFIKIKIENQYHNLKNKIRHGSSDFFDSVLIETSTACNRKCSYCPNSIYERGDIKNNKIIDFNLYKKIIDELKSINFKGTIKPFYYNEPLLNKNLEEFIKYTKENLKSSKIQIATNGDFLTLERYNSLVSAGIDAIYITPHSKEIPTHIKELFQKVKKNKEKVRIHYIHLSKESDLDNRGGLVEIKNKNQIPRCIVNPIAILISNEGDVFLCCNDYFRQHTFGNIKNEKIVDIWNKPAYIKLRNELKKGDYKLEICKKCTN